MVADAVSVDNDCERRQQKKMKCNLETFPKAAFPVSQMTSVELLDHILKLVNWKFSFKEELKEEIAFLDKTRKWTITRMEDFYKRLPNISDVGLVMAEFKEHNDELITHIQNLEQTIKQILEGDVKSKRARRRQNNESP